MVSTCAPWPASTRRPTPRADRSCTVLTRWARFPAEAVELPDDEHIALPQGVQAAVEPRPVVPDAGRDVVVDVDRVDAGRPQGVPLQVRSDHDAFGLVDGHRVRRPVVELRRLRRRVPPRFAGRAQVARCRRRERPRPVREPDPRGREDVGLDAAVGGGRAGSGPPGGLRSRTWDELGRGGRRDVDAGGETGVREPHGRARRRRPSAPADPSATASAATGVPGAKKPRRAELETLRGLRAFASGAELRPWTA